MNIAFVCEVLEACFPVGCRRLAVLCCTTHQALKLQDLNDCLNDVQMAPRCRGDTYTFKSVDLFDSYIPVYIYTAAQCDIRLQVKCKLQKAFQISEQFS